MRKYVLFCVLLFGCEVNTQAVYPLIPNNFTYDFTPAQTCRATDESAYLCVSPDAPEAVVNLSQTNIKDWVHWGLWSEVSVNRKANTNLISNYTLIGNPSETHQYPDNHVIFTWNDGFPTKEANTTNGIFVYGKGNGFAIEAPASPEVSVLEVYLSAYGADLELEAHTSDFSSPAFTLTLTKPKDELRIYKRFVFVYRSINVNEKLNVKWVNTKEHFAGSNVTLQAVVLR